ncbi:hypothetical protein KIN20_036480 [Parelaphostrongylus tenuis]|uniref:Metallothionein n=1 Tax=Parelaphostrongylus tenuis TaxID=148309 RepID=A0AAD5RD75_PARTN|nr:hypothetical protein KIN20_036480 [Parelaphostrongylus tenuis]
MAGKCAKCGCADGCRCCEGGECEKGCKCCSKGCGCGPHCKCATAKQGVLQVICNEWSRPLLNTILRISTGCD